MEQIAKVTQISQYYRHFELAATFIGANRRHLKKNKFTN